MNKPRRIGILGGMGPQATNPSPQEPVDAVQATDDHDHISLIKDMNPQVPSRIDHLARKSGDDPALAAMAKGLHAAGADALAMPFCTAQHNADAIIGAGSVPSLNMAELAAEITAKALARGGRIDIPASPAGQITGHFDKDLTQKVLKTIGPDNGSEMLRTIQAVKAKVQCPEAYNAASAELTERSAAFQLLARLEFSLSTDSIALGVPAADTLDIRVDLLCAFSFKNSGKLEHAK